MHEERRLGGGESRTSSRHWHKLVTMDRARASRARISISTSTSTSTSTSASTSTSTSTAEERISSGQPAILHQDRLASSCLVHRLLPGSPPVWRIMMPHAARGRGAPPVVVVVVVVPVSCCCSTTRVCSPPLHGPRTVHAFRGGASRFRRAARTTCRHHAASAPRRCGGGLASCAAVSGDATAACPAGVPCRSDAVATRRQ
jgi:hypothetical protein